MKVLNHIIVSTAILTITLMSIGCRPTEEPAPSLGVLDGRIGTGSFPVVVLTRSISTDDLGGSIYDKLIRWAKITISDGEKEVVLTGGPNSSMFPPYRYYTYDMVGDPGKTYTVHAEYEDIDIYASAKMPVPTPIESIDLVAVGNTGDKYSMTVNFLSPEDGPGYYYVTLRSDMRERSLPAFMGTVETRKEGGERYSIPVKKPKIRIDSVDYEPYFLSGEEWEVTLNRIDEDEFRFWNTYNSSLITGSSPFVGGDENLKGNVVGGYGIWSVCGSTEKIVRVP